MDKVDFTKLLSLTSGSKIAEMVRTISKLVIITVGMFDYFSFAPNGTNDFLKVDLEVCMRLQLGRK